MHKSSPPYCIRKKNYISITGCTSIFPNIYFVALDSEYMYVNSRSSPWFRTVVISFLSTVLDKVDSSCSQTGTRFKYEQLICFFSRYGLLESLVNQAINLGFHNLLNQYVNKANRMLLFLCSYHIFSCMFLDRRFLLPLSSKPEYFRTMNKQECFV